MELGSNKKKLAFSYIQRRLKEVDMYAGIGLCALRIIFDVLKECGLAEYSLLDGEKVVEIKLIPFKEKINLDKSPLLTRIKNNHKLY